MSVTLTPYLLRIAAHRVNVYGVGAWVDGSFVGWYRVVHVQGEAFADMSQPVPTPTFNLGTLTVGTVDGDGFEDRTPSTGWDIVITADEC
jgi:hypothetical protein